MIVFRFGALLCLSRSPARPCCLAGCVGGAVAVGLPGFVDGCCGISAWVCGAWMLARGRMRRSSWWIVLGPFASPALWPSTSPVDWARRKESMWCSCAARREGREEKRRCNGSPPHRNSTATQFFIGGSSGLFGTPWARMRARTTFKMGPPTHPTQPPKAQAHPKPPPTASTGRGAHGRRVGGAGHIF